MKQHCNNLTWVCLPWHEDQPKSSFISFSDIHCMSRVILMEDFFLTTISNSATNLSCGGRFVHNICLFEISSVRNEKDRIGFLALSQLQCISKSAMSFLLFFRNSSRTHWGTSRSLRFFLMATIRRRRCFAASLKRSSQGPMILWTSEENPYDLTIYTWNHN